MQSRYCKIPALFGLLNWHDWIKQMAFTAFQRNAFQDNAFQIDDLPTGRSVQRITTGPLRDKETIWIDEWTKRIHAINEEEKRQKLIKKLKKRKVITLMSDFFFDD